MSNITFTIADIRTAIKRHLSTIGKRLYTKEGKNMFSDVTLSSAEDTNMLNQYINASAQDVESVLKQFVTTSTYSDSSIVMAVSNMRGDTDFDSRTKALAESYITLNSVGEYLSMMHPDIAQKYQRDARQRIESLVSYVFYKKTPTATADPLAASSSVS